MSENLLKVYLQKKSQINSVIYAVSPVPSSQDKAEKLLASLLTRRLRKHKMPLQLELYFS